MSFEAGTLSFTMSHCPKKAMIHQLRPQSQFNLRLVWAEAELLVFGKLRLGVHPEQLEQELNRNLKASSDDNDEYRVLFQSTCQRILDNLKRQKLFKKLPRLSVYSERMEDPLRKARFQVMMYNRFDDEEAFRQSAMDEGMEWDMAEDDPLDSTILETLIALRETMMKEVEENYITNRKFLEDSPPAPFASTDAENPFVYAAYKRSWEGPGNMPGHYVVPQGIYVPRHRKPALETAPEPGPDVVKTNKEFATLTSQDSTSDEAAFLGDRSISSFKSAQTSVTIPSMYPHTPANKAERPNFCYENAGNAIFALPVGLGSPAKDAHHRSWENDATTFRCMETGCCDTNLENDDFDLPEDIQQRCGGQDSLVSPKLGEDEGQTSAEGASQSLEECMNWAEEIIQKYPLPDICTISGGGSAWNNAMDWD